MGIGVALPGVVASLLLAGVLITILDLTDAQIGDDSVPIVTDWDIWIVLLATAVIAPIGEEIFFRGFITNAWARSLARREALLRGTFLFAAVHILNYGIDLDQLDLTIRLAILAVTVRLPVAWLLGWIYTSRRSIVASIVLHGTYNGALVAIAWWASNLPG
jgi:membrane protease YdiL (CAAX protease family)